MNTVTQNEPAVSIGVIVSAILAAVYAILKASDVGVTDEMTSGINSLVLALCAIPAVSGFVTRFFVFSPNTTERLTDESYLAGLPPTTPKPPVPTPPANE